MYDPSTSILLFNYSYYSRLVCTEILAKTTKMNLKYGINKSKCEFKTKRWLRYNKHAAIEICKSQNGKQTRNEMQDGKNYWVTSVNKNNVLVL